MNTKLTPRLLTESDITTRQLVGYYIKLQLEYSPLNLRVVVDLRRWNESGGVDPDEATKQALAYFNEEIQRMALHLEMLSQ